MNTVGKVLTGVVAFLGILILALSVMVLRLSPDWKAMAAEAKTDLDNAKKQTASLELELKSLDTTRKNEQGLLLANYQGLDAAVKQGEQDVEKREKDRLDAEKQLQDSLSNMEAAAANLKDALAQRETIQNQLQTTQEERDKWFQTVTRMTDELNQRKAELSSLIASNESLVQNVSRYQEILEKENVDAAAYSDKPLPLDAHVVEVLDRMVAVSAGSDQGLKKGDTLEIYRKTDGQARYLGRVEVVETQADRANCRILPEFTRDVIQQGDQASVNLS